MLVVWRPNHDGVDIVASQQVFVGVNLVGGAASRTPDLCRSGFSLGLPNVADCTYLSIGAILKLEHLPE